jgi:hypothetical protein
MAPRWETPQVAKEKARKGVTVREEGEGQEHHQLEFISLPLMKAAQRQRRGAFDHHTLCWAQRLPVMEEQNLEVYKPSRPSPSLLLSSPLSSVMLSVSSAH